MKYVTLKCPACGKNIKAEKIMTAFFCLHCGTKITVTEDNSFFYYQCDTEEENRKDDEEEEEVGEGLFDKLFWNIGGKIKTLTKVCFIFELVLFTIASLYLMFIIDKWYSILLSLLLMAVGFLVAWITSFFVYGFGELIETNSKIARTSAKQNRLLKQLGANKKNEKNTTEETTTPSHNES